MKKFLKGLLIFVGVGAAVAIVFAMTFLPAPLAAVKTFFGAVERHDYEIAYELFHSDLCQFQTFEEFTSVAKMHSSTFEADYRLWSTDVEAGSATVEGQLTMLNGGEAEVLFLLVEQNGEWQIVGYLIRDESGSVDVGLLP